VHHLGESHMYANVRFKLALTYDYPVILPIDDKCRNYLITNCKLISHYCCSKTKEYRKVLNVLFFSVVYFTIKTFIMKTMFYLITNQLLFFNLSFISLFLSTDYGYKRG
jgi:hypothetical protein